MGESCDLKSLYTMLRHQINDALQELLQRVYKRGNVYAEIRKTVVKLQKVEKRLSTAFHSCSSREGAHQLLNKWKQLMQRLCNAAANLPSPSPFAPSPTQLVGQLQLLDTQLEQLCAHMQPTNADSARAVANPATPQQQQQQQQQHMSAAHAAHPHSSSAVSAASMPWVSVQKVLSVC